MNGETLNQRQAREAQLLVGKSVMGAGSDSQRTHPLEDCIASEGCDSEVINLLLTPMHIEMARCNKVTEEIRDAATESGVEASIAEKKNSEVEGETPISPIESQIPTSVIVTRPEPENPEEDQLFLDRIPVPKELWQYDSYEKILRWHCLYGGGSLHIAPVGNGGYGVVGEEGEEVSVRISSTASFLCDVAPDCGVTYIESGGRNIGFKWDAESDKWKDAKWESGRLKLEYTVTTPTAMDPPEFTFKFTDYKMDDDWKPEVYEASLGVGSHKGLPVWQLKFHASDSDPMGSIFPDFMEAEEDMAAYFLNGALEIIDEDDPKKQKKKLFGMKGMAANGAAFGYYILEGAEAPFGIFDGALYIAGKIAPQAVMRGNKLSWRGLKEEQGQKTGLGTEGSMEFELGSMKCRLGISNEGERRETSEFASTKAPASNPVTARRLSAEEALQKLVTREKLSRRRKNSNDAEAAPAFNTENIAKATRAGNAEALDIITLLGMTTFVQDDKGRWYDAIQKQISDDMSKIMNDSIPKDMWDMLFPSKVKPPLTSYLSQIKSIQVAGHESPEVWYGKMATAVLSSSMSEGSFEGCKLLNGIRASKWLRMQTAASPIHYKHSQELFHHHFKERYPWITKYFKDQEENWTANNYEKQIKDRTERAKKDIDEKVVEPTSNLPNCNLSEADRPKTDPPKKTIKQQLKDELDESCKHAVDNKQYWAFAYYTYTTTPAILANIALQISMPTGSGDGMTLSRMIQQNIAVLTALDKSEYFSKKYVETINTFLSTNILISMCDFSGNPEDFDIIKAYIKKIMELYINSSDAEIAAALRELKTALDKEGADALIREAMELITEIAQTTQDIAAFPYIAKRFVQVFKQKHPTMSGCAELFGSMVLGGLGIFAVFNIITVCKSWDKMSAAEKAELIISATDLGIQFVAAVVKRGVRTYALYKSENLTTGQRLCGLSKIWTVGEAAGLDTGLIKVSNSMARWLADTEGSLGKLAILDETGAIAAVMLRTSEEEASLVTKVLGRNMDEFIATRLGPIVILASIGFSIYNLTKDLDNMEKASEILNICSGALMLCAIAGEWAISAGLIAASGILSTIISGAAFLGIIAAVAGIILMICQMFKDPPDPVKDFIEKYAKGAGFALSSPRGAFDYAIPYLDSQQNNLLIVGFQMTSTLIVEFWKPAKIWKVAASGSITVEEQGGYTPEYVLQAQTDEFGKTKIYTIVKDVEKNSIQCVYLSLLKDNSVKFCHEGDEKVLTNFWYSDTLETTLSEDGRYLKTAWIIPRAAVKNKDGSYKVGMYLTVEKDKVVCQEKPNTTILKFKMCGMAPNYMQMKDLIFYCGKLPYESSVFGPSFGVTPSTPCKFTLSGAAAESAKKFLSFAAETGEIRPIKDKVPDQRLIGGLHIRAENILGSEEVNFILDVK